MDVEANGNVSSKGQSLSQLSALEKLNLGDCLTKDEAAGEMLKLPKKPSDSIVPATPDLKQDALDFKSPISCLPKAMALCFSSQDGILSSNGDSPRTPKESVFDPFAPGPEQLLLAPLCLKKTGDPRIGVARMLNFEECTRVLNFEECGENATNMDAITSDEQLLGKLYRMLLQIVISKHTEEVLVGNPTPVSDSDGDRTPTSPQLLSGIAESCPAAPKKTARKFISIDKGLCKKLEF